VPITNINIIETISNAKKVLEEDKTISVSTRAVFKLLLSLIELLIPKLVKTTSKNSNLPPSMDLTKSTKNNKPKSGKKPGAQQGHTGKTLELVKNPDEIIPLKIDRRTLPKGKIFTQGTAKRRQITDIKITKFVTEYVAEVLIDEDGKEYVASFPDNISNQTQYGNSIKSQICYFSVYQMLPFLRTQDFFNSHSIPISEGSIDNTLSAAALKLTPFLEFIKNKLLKQNLLHSDETGCNLNGKNAWIHNYSTDRLTYLFADLKRGKEAMDGAGILPHFKGMLVHDHWKPYLSYPDITHIFCNDHISRELQRIIDTSNYSWAVQMQSFLQELNKTAPNAPAGYLKRYGDILELAKKECPEDKNNRAQSRACNLIKRLTEFKYGTVAFATNKLIPFTNNQAERDLRMLKVKLKVSGCFKTLESMQRFCLIRSFVSTCLKNSININDAFNMLFAGDLDKILQIIEASG
jgi:transposase